MAVQVVNAAPLAFEQIVLAEMTTPLAAHGFNHEPPFHLFKNKSVTFLRERQGQQERIEFQRASYSEEQMQTPATDDEVEYEPHCFEDEQRCWVSRHFMVVHFIVNGAFNNLLTSGTSLVKTACVSDYINYYR